MISLVTGQSRMNTDRFTSLSTYSMENIQSFSGSVSEFYDSGSEKLTGRYKNGLRNGKWVWYNENGEIEYIFVNPIFRKKGVATKLLKLVKNKTKKKIILQKPISPLGSKLLKSIEKWF